MYICLLDKAAREQLPVLLLAQYMLKRDTKNIGHFRLCTFTRNLYRGIKPYKMNETIYNGTFTVRRLKIYH